jgi:hypothetical protein
MKSLNPTQLLSRTLAAGLLAVTLALGSGCFLVAVGAAGAAGAGTVAYIEGRLDATLASNYDAVVNAATSSVDQLHLVLVTQKKDALSTELTARTAEDTKVVITVSRQDSDPNITKVSIRVGTFGNEAFSRTILDQIKRDI